MKYSTVTTVRGKSLGKKKGTPAITQKHPLQINYSRNYKISTTSHKFASKQ